MKNVLTIFGFIGLLVFSSCGSSVESDAKKAAQLQCKIQNLMKDAVSLEDMQSVQEKAEPIKKELEEFEKSVKDKYTDPADQKKFMEVMAKEMENCK